jgi:hypothetical protein
MRRLSLIGAIAVVVGCDGGIGGGTAGNAGTSGGAGTTGGAGRTGMAGTTGSAGTTGRGTNPLSQALIDAFVTAHNAARSGPLNPPPSPALPPVSWDALLADAAYNYATRCMGSGGLLDHNDGRSEDYQALGGSGYVGENIYGTTANTVQPSAAVDSWMSEASVYNYAQNNIDAAGHYTQVVWRASVRIGCAIVDCPALRFHNTVICDYAPGGNIGTQKPY